MGTTIFRRGFVGAAATTAALALAGAVLPGCGGQDTKGGTSGAQGGTGGMQGDNEKAAVGYWGGTCEAPIFVAYAKGYFMEEGIGPGLTLLDAAGGTSSDALVAKGEVDCYELTPDKFKPIQ